MKKNIKIFIASLFLTTTMWAQPCKEVVGYYCDWLTTTVDYSKYTILNYAFVQPNTDGTVNDGNATLMASLVSGAHSHNVKVMLSIGGWTWSDNFPTIAASATTRNKFASECQRYITKYGLDGIDIDWEYPGFTDHSGTTADKANYTLLMTAIRSAIGNKLLSGCFGVSNDHMQNIEWSKVSTILDMINLMTYDFFGTWDATTNHNSPLYQPAQGEPTFNVNSAFQRLSSTFGVPASKINLGVAFYGHAFTGATALFGPATGADGDGSPIYSVIEANKGTYTDYWDDQAKVPYMIDANAKKFISYDNEKSVELKGQYITSHSAHGAIIWEISGDRIGSSNPLAAALVKGLCSATSVNEQSQQEATFYPNPTRDNVSVILANGSTKNQVTVYNAIGQVVSSQLFEQSQFSINLKGMEKGFYFINISNDNGIITKKIIKE